MRVQGRVFKVTCWLSLVAVVLQASSTSAPAGELLDCYRKVHAHLFETKRPSATREHPVESYAKQIDWLEHKIDNYGTVVPKHPDIWGQARLQKHREEFEEEMLKDVSTFKESLQGSIARSDQSYLALAYSLNKSSTGTSASASAAYDMLGQAPTPNPASSATQKTRFDAMKSDFRVNTLSLEPTLTLDQKSRFLNHLHELRRINEGDDTSDAPGYALYLARIPVSVLPGKRTFEGYGAEITFNVEPNLTPELLPITFRNLVINDVADQLALPVTRMLEDNDKLEALNSTLTAFDAIDDWEAINVILAKKNPETPLFQELWAQIRKHYSQQDIEDYHIQDKLIWEIVKEIIYWYQTAPQSPRHQGNPNAAKNPRAKPLGSGSDADLSPKAMQLVQRNALMSRMSSHVWAGQSTSLQNLMYVSQRVAVSRQHPLAIPPTQIEDVYGEGHVLAHVVLDAWDAIESDNKPGMVHLPDVKAFLKTELAAAYDFLSLPETLYLWEKHCTPRLAETIRARKRWMKFPPDNDSGSISQLRTEFFADIIKNHERATHTTTISLAWGIIVESALLDQALKDDMQRVSREKGCNLPSGPHRFYLPKPLPVSEDVDPDCRQQYDQHLIDLDAAAAAFNDYVRCRWPIIVFALDPETDDQNIADVFSRRRELQLAISVAVAQGKVGPSAAGRFVRSLETDIETIAINRNAVAFSHGNDTFGWRFYPRVQTPPDVGNIKAFHQTLFGVKPYADLRKRRLEPGIRECSAVIIMPSFVPHATFTSRANWFGVTNPGKKELTLHDTMELSRTFQGLQGYSQRVRECGSYRPGDVAQLTRVVQQLDRKLPLQQAMVQIPYENTVGGFEMFTTGLTDLGPELHGWYGAPGILVTAAPAPSTPAAAGGKDPPPTAPTTCPTGSGTVLFLVGNHFSVHRSRVIAGGRCVPSRMLSREIMEVVIPENVLVTMQEVNGKSEPRVDVHVATPYGVTSHLLVPLVSPAGHPAPVAKAAFEAEPPAEMHLLATYSPPESGETVKVYPNRLDHVEQFKISFAGTDPHQAALARPGCSELACGLYKDGKLMRPGLGMQFTLTTAGKPLEDEREPAPREAAQGIRFLPKTPQPQAEAAERTIPAGKVYDAAKLLIEKLNRLDFKDADEVKLELAFFLVSDDCQTPVAAHSPIPIVVHIRKKEPAAPIPRKVEELPPAPPKAPSKAAAEAGEEFSSNVRSEEPILSPLAPARRAELRLLPARPGNSASRR